MSLNPVQVQPFSIAGAGVVTGATSITLNSFTDIEGNLLTMSDFGTIGYGTIDPGNGTLEEQIQFTGVTQNTNGTATLTGVSSVGFYPPYTVTTGLVITHTGAAPFVISNTAAFYTQFAVLANAETISGLWTFTTPPIGINPGGQPNASETIAGIVQLATRAQAASSIYAGSSGARLVIPTSMSTSIGASGTTVAVISQANGTIAPAFIDGTGNYTFSGTTIFSGVTELNGTTTVAGVTLATSKFGGTGSDGALAISSGTTTINLGGAETVTKNYTSISISGNGALAFSNPHVNGTLVTLKSQGNVTLTSSATPMIIGSGLGSSGGAAASGASTNGNDGASSLANIPMSFGGGVHGLGGGGSGGAGGTSTYALAAFRYAGKLITLAPGAGGGSGGTGGSASNTSGVGGNGGAALYIECAGAWNFTTTGGISVVGATGGAPSGGTAHGGGGGGGGGTFFALYNTLTANSGTVTVSGGNGGTGNAGASNGSGGGGGGGTTTNGSAGATSTASGNGGTGGTGFALIEQNVDFV